MEKNGAGAMVAPDGWLSSDQPDLYFEDNAIGRMKHEPVARRQRRDRGGHRPSTAIPPLSSGRGQGSYLADDAARAADPGAPAQRHRSLPIGCTENHGRHLPSATDTLFCSQIVEGVRRFVKHATARRPRCAYRR